MAKRLFFLFAFLALTVVGLFLPESAIAKQGSCPADYYECKCGPPEQTCIGPGCTSVWACCASRFGPFRVCTDALYFADEEHSVTADPELAGKEPEGYGGGTTPEPVLITPTACAGSTAESPIIETALGCIPTTPAGFIARLFEIGVFTGGGIAFLFMCWGAFLLLTSQGTPEQIQQGKEVITSAIIGLLFIVFAVFLLRLIGVDILRIPGFV